MNRSRLESPDPAAAKRPQGLEPDPSPDAPFDPIGRVLSQHADEGPAEQVTEIDPTARDGHRPGGESGSLLRKMQERLARSAAWFQATPAELLGLIVLLLGACAVTLVVLWDAGSRPTALPPAAVGAGSGADHDHGDLGQPGHPAHPAGDASTLPDPGYGEASGTSSGSDGAAGAGGPNLGPGAGVGEDVTVYVSGAVSDPGVVVLGPGARVGDALTAAGGAIGDADLARLNLARPLVDGEQVHVPLVGEAVLVPDPGPDPASGPGGQGAGTDAQGRIDLNRADQALLETLPGIGPAKAAAIIAHRDAEGPFKVPGDLRAVSGIGERTFQQLADLISVG